MRRIVILAIVATSVASSGCGLSLPRIGQPGFLREQQLRATVYDPYASLDMAPEVIGGRPRMYDRPRTQVTQSQWQLDQP